MWYQSVSHPIELANALLYFLALLEVIVVLNIITVEGLKPMAGIILLQFEKLIKCLDCLVCWLLAK